MAVRHYAILIRRFEARVIEKTIVSGLSSLRGAVHYLLTITMSASRLRGDSADYLQKFANVRSEETNRGSDQVFVTTVAVQSTIKAESFWPVQFQTITVLQLRGVLK